MSDILLISDFESLKEHQQCADYYFHRGNTVIGAFDIPHLDAYTEAKYADGVADLIEQRHGIMRVLLNGVTNRNAQVPQQAIDKAHELGAPVLLVSLNGRRWTEAPLPVARKRRRVMV